MSKQTGLIRLKGTMGGVTFYKSEGEDLARIANGPDKGKIENDPAFQRTRENNAEFGGAATVAKALRVSLVSLLQTVSDSKLISRMTQTMKLINARGNGPRGQRSFELLNNKALLIGFEFNKKTSFSSVFNAPFVFSHTMTRNAASIDVAGFMPRNYIPAPAGATHFRLIAGIAVVSNYVFNSDTRAYEPFDPEANGLNAITFSDYRPLDSPAPVAFNLNTILPSGPDIGNEVAVVHCLGIEFYQQIAGVNYLLAQSNAMKIINVF